MTEESKFMPDAKARKFEKPEGWDVYRWPEFIALAERLGIDLGTPTTILTIRIPLDDPVGIIHEYLGLDITKEKPKEE